MLVNYALQSYKKKMTLANKSAFFLKNIWSIQKFFVPL